MIARLDQILSRRLEHNQESLINGSTDRIARLRVCITYDKFHKEISTNFEYLLISVAQLWEWFKVDLSRS